MLSIKNLYLSYNDSVFIDNMSLELPLGKIIGFLGANGAGKTSIIECLEGVRTPDRGEILYHGKKIDTNYRLGIGIQFQEVSFFSKLKVEEILGFSIDMFGSKIVLDDLLIKFELFEHRKKLYAELSGGMKKKISLAVVSINTNAQIIFLDEPTAGLDVFSRKNFWKIIKNFKSEGKTVILATHFIEEAEKLCDHIVVLNNGKVVEQNPPEVLMRNYCKNFKIEVEVKEAFAVADFLAQNPNILQMAKLPFGEGVYEIILNPENFNDESFGRILDYFIKNKLQLISCRIKQYDLETAILTILGFTLNDLGEISE